MPTPRFPTVDAVLTAARSQLGTTEHPPGSNKTPYGRALGVDGEPWCGSFAWACFQGAGVDLRRAGVPHPEYTPAFAADAVKAGWRPIAKSDIRPGDVLFFDFEPPVATTGIQHVEFATSAPSAGYVRTIGGNTSSGTVGSQDNGGGVFERVRPLSVVAAVVRPPYAPVKRPVVVTVARAAAAVSVPVAVVAGVTVAHPAQRLVPVPRPSATAPAKPRQVIPARKPAAKPVKPSKPANPKPPVIIGPLGYGSTGPAVVALQKRLKVRADGLYGRRTLLAVEAVQAAADLPADGVVGPNTARAMGLPYVPANRP